MKQSSTLIVSQVQRLTLTPDLRLSLSILQMSFAELENYLSQQILENCMLEPIEAEDSEDSIIQTLSLDSLKADESFYNNSPGIDYLFEDNGPDWTLKFNNISPAYPFEISNSSTPSLQEYLTIQLHLIGLSQKDNRIAEFLIGNIDDDGYLRLELKEIAVNFQISLEASERLLRLIQAFDPPGVGARSIKECLLLQLHFKKRQFTDLFSRRKPVFSLAEAIVEQYLSDLAENKLAKISKQLNVSLPEVQAAADLIRSLDPKPGRNFINNQPTHFIIPDIFVRKIHDEYHILINEPDNARLTVSPFYRQLIRNHNDVDGKTLKFLKDKQNAALNLIKCIEQRKSTLYKVTESILHIQKEFLEKGGSELKPLTLRQVAEMIEIHESTVCRAIAGKYIETPKGTYPLGFFFSTGLESRNGSRVSVTTVKKLIKSEIEAEDPKFPLSDQQLTELLRNRGINISRRTVAKYREEMKIFSSEKRRRY